MKKVETSIENLRKDIQDYYKLDKCHFIVMNAVDLGEKLELQWFFSDYEPPYEVTTFYLYAQHDAEVPSIKDIISSAWVAEAELADLMDINIENALRGFVLEPDSPIAPLRKSN